MVSTRSGRVTNSVQSVPSRSRPRRDAAADDTYVELGQPEVSSPAPPLARALADSPASFEAFGSPLTEYPGVQTPENQTGVPLYEERLIKTVGKVAMQTPSQRLKATANTAATPSAKEVEAMARIPLPEDMSSGETEPFASSEDEPAGPASPEKVPHDLSNIVVQEPEVRRSGPGRLFGLFTLSSLLTTLIIALLLSPCADQELYAQLQSPTYERICKTMVQLQKEVAARSEDLSWRVSAFTADKLSPLCAKVPAEAEQALVSAWAVLQDAHGVARTALQTLAQEAHERTTPLQQTVKAAYLSATRAAFTTLAPLVREALSHVNKAIPAAGMRAAVSTTGMLTAPSASASPSAISLVDFLAIVDQSPQQQQYVQELWHAAERQVATKQKAVAWAIACRHEAECRAALATLLSAARSWLDIDGQTFSQEHDAGKLQSELATFLRAYPGGLVAVSSANRLHSSCVAVLNAAISESGHLQVDGAPLATNQALYVFLVKDAVPEEAHAEGDADVEHAVKERLCRAIADVEPDTPSSVATILSFRRRIDAVLLARKVERSGQV